MKYPENSASLAPSQLSALAYASRRLRSCYTLVLDGGQSARRKSNPRNPSARLTAVKNAAKRLNKTHYKVLRLIAARELEAELVDGKHMVTIASLERLEAARG
jgi:hypothetical protein